MFDCLVIGDVMFDVFVRQPVANLSFLPNGTAYCDFAGFDFGGGGNVAVALSLIGVRTCFVGKAGNDVLGRLYNGDLKSKGVKSRLFFEKGQTTGISFVVIGEEGSRSFQVFRGANDRLTIADVERYRTLLLNSKYFFFSGYSLVNSPQREAICYAVKVAKANNVKLVFDPGAYNLIESNFQLFEDLLDSSDVFSLNIDEAKAITKTSSAKEAIQRLAEREQLTAIKCGSEGCMLVEDGNCVSVPSLKSECQDTTGAGDAFDAALIFGLINGLPLAQIGQFANWFAARVVQKTGARSYPTKKQVQRFLGSIL
jgi:sugar/nucleoside kinase (ribokinase family)